MNCPQCGRPMELKVVSEHWCFDCNGPFHGWQCSDCRLRAKTGCPHVEAEGAVAMPTTEEFREGLKVIFEGRPAE
jgi:hypothetical protein